MPASKGHKNKHVHNWLVYRSGDRLLDKYASRLQGTLIDLGCGEAPYRDYFLQHAASYTGVDWSDTQHESRADVISDLNSHIDLDANSADTLVSLSVMEHLKEPQIFLDEAYRILRPGGSFILQVPWQWHIHEAPHDYFRFSPYGLRYLLEKAGFREIIIEAQSGYFTSAALKFNYFTARLIQALAMPLKYLFALLLLPFWTLAQVLAPLLDKLDRDWARESSGYFVVCKK